MKNQTIGIVIPSFNDQDFLQRLFESLYSYSAGSSFIPVIVDDSSTDPACVQFQNSLSSFATIIRTRSRSNFTKVCNIGIDHLRKETDVGYYFLLNSDTYVTPGWAAALIATHMKFSAGIVGATLLYPDGRIQHAGAYGVGYHYGINEPRVRHYKDKIVPWVTGAAMCISRETVETAGYLPYQDDGMQYDESDRNFCVTARMQFGVEIAVSAGCIIYHDTHKAEAIRRGRGDY